MQQNQLASVNYNRLAQLKKHTGADNNLWLVYDAVVFSWQNSKIVQKGKKLCCPTISRIAELANVSTRTVLRKLKILEQMGLIDSFTKRLRNGTVRRFFNVCIEKISSITNLSSKKPQDALQSSNHAGSDNLSLPDVTDCHSHIYKEKTVKEKNNINNNTAIPESNKPADQQNIVNVNFIADAQVDVTLPANQVAKTEKPENKVSNTLTNRQHCRINGAINNLIRKEGVRISDPKGLKEQVAFKILLKGDKSGGSNFQHQLNSAMKLIRESKWSTPHGFYKYSDEGMTFKSARQENEKKWQDTKKLEVRGKKIIHNNEDRSFGITTCRQNKAFPGNKNLKLTPAGENNTDNHAGRVCVDGEYILKSDATSRLDSITDMIFKYTERLSLLPDQLKSSLVDVILRLKDEAQSLRFALKQ